MSSGALDWRQEGPSWPHCEHSRFIQRSGIRWHVQIMGSGPALLLLHGTGASSHSFRDLMPILASRFTVVAPDLPGHAFSAAPLPFKPSLSNTARALAELLRTLALTPMVAVGHSAGAALLARMALDRDITPKLLVGLGAALVPFRGLTALFAPTAARMMSGSRLAAQVLALRAREPTSVERLVRSTGSSLNARGIELYQRLARNPVHVTAVLTMLADWDLASLFAELPMLDVQFLLLAGENDRAIPLAQQRELATQLRRARLHVVQAAGHLLHEERPTLVAQLLLAEIDAALKDQR